MRILVVNGPNLNMLGIREPGIYGKETYEDLVKKVTSYGEKLGISTAFCQSNHEGDLVDAIQQAYFTGVDGIVLNPGAYTHTSVALLDALKAVRIPTVEVHISEVSKREAFRSVSYIREACIATVTGEGLAGYCHAVDLLLQHLGEKKEEAT